MKIINSGNKKVLYVDKIDAEGNFIGLLFEKNININMSNGYHFLAVINVEDTPVPLNQTYLQLNEKKIPLLNNYKNFYYAFDVVNNNLYIKVGRDLSGTTHIKISITIYQIMDSLFNIEYTENERLSNTKNLYFYLQSIRDYKFNFFSYLVNTDNFQITIYKIAQRGIGMNFANNFFLSSDNFTGLSGEFSFSISNNEINKNGVIVQNNNLYDLVIEIKNNITSSLNYGITLNSKK